MAPVALPASEVSALYRSVAVPQGCTDGLGLFAPGPHNDICRRGLAQLGLFPSAAVGIHHLLAQAHHTRHHAADIATSHELASIVGPAATYRR